MRPVPTIAREILHVWSDKVYFGALPYLLAMIADDCGYDGKESVILYFLSNATTFRGATARRLKAELREHLAK